MLNGEDLLEYTNLFFPNDYDMNDKIIKKFFLWIYFKKVRMRKIYYTKWKKCKNFKKPKTSYICNKKLHLSSISNKCGREDKKIFDKEESIEILQILCLIVNIEEY